MNNKELRFDGGDISIEVVYDYEKKKPLVRLTVCDNVGCSGLAQLTADEARMVGEALYQAAMEADKK